VRRAETAASGVRTRGGRAGGASDRTERNRRACRSDAEPDGRHELGNLNLMLVREGEHLPATEWGNGVGLCPCHDEPSSVHR
jgi:hypothetical protein